MSEQVADRQTMRKECAICPRQCRIDRSVNSGYCGEGESVRVARASLHRWEEPCISGESGSGTVFFSQAVRSNVCSARTKKFLWAERVKYLVCYNCQICFCVCRRAGQRTLIW